MQLDRFEEATNPPKKATAFRVTVAVVMAYILYYAAATFSYHIGMGMPVNDISENTVPDISILHK